MDKPTLLLKIDELRKKYIETKNPIDRKVIEIRGKMLKIALSQIEKREPSQKSLLP